MIVNVYSREVGYQHGNLHGRGIKGINGPPEESLLGRRIAW